MLVKLLRTWGVDRAIAYTVLGRSWTFLAGPITLLLLVRFLSGDEQGFYYTFSSVLGLQVLFELGLSFVIFQFASHEKAKLHWTEAGTLEGEPEAKERLFSLLGKAVCWYAVLAVLIQLILIPGGLFFFNQYNATHSSTHIAWQFPWVWVVVATAGDLLSSPIVAVLEGSGLVTEVALVRAVQTVVGSLLMWVVLLLHGRLLSAPVSNTVVVLTWWIWIGYSKRNFLKQLLTFRRVGKGIDWRREVWPFQWKIALSGISSYFIYLLFTPVLFRFQGATIAGQMGMSMTVTGAIALVSLSWVSTKMSPFGTLIAQRNFKSLDELFFPSLWKSVGVFLVLSISFLIVVQGLRMAHDPLTRRILPTRPPSVTLNDGPYQPCGRSRGAVPSGS